jgi:pentatricopeptide repeat protein
VQVWEDMREAGVEANSYVYVALINACEQDCDWQRAVKVYYAMKVRTVLLSSCAI